MSFDLIPRLESGFYSYWQTFVGRARAQLLRWRGAQLGQRVRIGPRCRVQRPRGLAMGVAVEVEHDVYIKITHDTAQVQIGDRAFLGRGVEFDVSHHVHVGSDVLIAPGCFITDHSHRYRAGATIASQGCKDTDVFIADDVWLGAHSIVLAGVNIGRGAVVGANSVVTRNVDAMTIVAGSPARPIGRRA